MTEDEDTGPGGGRAVASRLVYDASIATVDEATFYELVAVMRDGQPRKRPRPRRYGGAPITRRCLRAGRLVSNPTCSALSPSRTCTMPSPGLSWTGNPNPLRRNWRGSHATAKRRLASADRR